MTYNSYPNTPSSVKVNGVAPASGSTFYTNDTTPTFSATVSDPDGGSVKGKFSLGGGTAVSGSSVTSGSTSSYTPSALANGSSRTVQVWANDGSLDSKASSNPTWTVVVDTAAPGTTTVTSPQFDNGQWLDTAPTSVSATLTATDAVTFEYTIDGATQTPLTASSGSATIPTANLDTTNGGHRIEARAVDRANNTGAWTTFEYGIGSVGITAPAASYKTTDKVTVKGTAPTATNGTIAPAVYWRKTGTGTGSGATGSAAGWTKIADLPTIATAASASVSYPWSASSSVPSGYERQPYPT